MYEAYICNRSSSAAAAAGTTIKVIRLNTYLHAAMSVPAYLLQRGAAEASKEKKKKEKMSLQASTAPLRVHEVPVCRVSLNKH